MVVYHDHRHHTTIYVIGSWISIFLYSMEITLGAYFFLHHKQNRFQKFSLGGTILLDTVCTTFVCYYAWLHTDVSRLAETSASWCEAIIIILTYMISVFEQLYLLHRYWIIARNKTVVSLVLLGAIVHLICGFIAGIYVLAIPQLASQIAVPFLTIAAVTCPATDLLIAINMFRGARSIDTIDTSTQSLLYRLSTIAMGSGVITATATTLQVVLIFTSVPAFIFVFNLVGRLYTLTIIVNCIALKRHKNTGVPAGVARTPANSTSPGSLVLTPLEFHTFTIPEDIETDSDAPSSRVK